MWRRFLLISSPLLCGLLVEFGGFTKTVEAEKEEGPGAPSTQLAQLQPMHEFHVNEFGLECTDCHSVPESPAKGQESAFSVRPGHSNCDSCHSDVFETGELVTFCMVCHVGEVYDLSPFPSGQDSISTFSHAQHVDPKGRVNKQMGLRQDCVFCHGVEPQMVAPSMPSHPQCASCHAGLNAVQPVLSEEEGNAGCLSCHDLAIIDGNIMAEGMVSSETSSPLQMAAHREDSRQDSYKDVVSFPHGHHLKARDGSLIQCTFCHESILGKTELEMASELPVMIECAACHDIAAKVGKANRTENCELCHTTIREDFRPGHEELAASVAHTASFRRNHGLQARGSNAYCDYCHNLTRATGNSCAQCHSVMKPASHFAARFEETTHGRLAAMQRQACATCHEVDFCSRCHNIPPRSHTPLPLFAGGGLHRELAAFNLRSCFTCHTFQADCSQCHAQVLRPPN